MTALRPRLPDLGLSAFAAAAAAFGWLAATRPAFAIAAAVGLVFMALVAIDLTVGLCVFVFVSFIDVLPGGPAFSLAKVLGLLLALSWLATIATRDDAGGDFLADHPGAVYLLGLFLVWAGISTLWAEHGSEAVTAASRYGLNLLLFPIVYTAIRKREHAGWVAWTFVAGALFTTAFGFVSPQPTEEGRLTGAIGEANELASVLVAGFAIAAGLALVSKRSPALRLAALGAAPGCVGGVLFSHSRAGLLALAVVLVASIFVAGRWRGRAALVALIAALGAVVYFSAFASPQAREHVTRVSGGTGRADLWTIAWRMTEDKPLTGVGAGNFQLVSPQYLLEPGVIARDDFVLDQPKQTHNIYLQVLAELGLPGLLLFGSIIGFSLYCAAGAARRFRALGDSRLETLSWAFLIAAIGVLAADFFQSEQFSKQLWLLLALGPALLALAHRGDEA
jgi:putative inorganic carbon (HCO3(-)) transporter